MKIEKNYFKNIKRKIDKALKSYINFRIPIIGEAMKYALFPGGKRFRAILCYVTSEILGTQGSRILPFCCAVELIHNYSLIHDDLPAIDNENFRRGKLTLHKKFNEAIAIFTGDALLSKSFELMSSTKLPKDRILKAINLLSNAIGPSGMILGQILDIQKPTTNLKKRLYLIHLNKTAKFIEAIVEACAIISAASPQQRTTLKKYARDIGLAFQIIDDLSDKDIDKNRLSSVTVYGIKKSYRIAKNLIEKAKKLVKKEFGEKSLPLQYIADEIINTTKALH